MGIKRTKVIPLVDEITRKALLLDFYGPLLTERQREVMELVRSEDLSLSEAAEQLGFTRQAAYDAVNKSEAALEEFEERLGLVRQYLNERNVLKQIVNELRLKKTETALEKLEGMIEI